MSAENVTPAPEAEDAVVETPAGQGSRVAEQDDAAVSEAVRRLEQEGDVAADYVEELLDIADLDGDIDIEVRDGRTYVSVVSPRTTTSAWTASSAPTAAPWRPCRSSSGWPCSPPPGTAPG